MKLNANVSLGDALRSSDRQPIVEKFGAYDYATVAEKSDAGVVDGDGVACDLQRFTNQYAN